jgi:uncharacterized LabA/DUF88 family protein
MLRKILAVDHAYARRIAVDRGHPHFPAEFRQVVQRNDDVDLLESLVFVVKPVPASDSPEDVAATTEQTERLCYALEMNGWRTVICPAKRSGDGFKQSDDARLVIESLALCLRLRPDFFVLFAGDGDFAPLVWALREEGIRTEVIASSSNLASDLRRAAYSVVEAEPLFQALLTNL